MQVVGTRKWKSRILHRIKQDQRLKTFFIFISDPSLTQTSVSKTRDGGQTRTLKPQNHKPTSTQTQLLKLCPLPPSAMRNPIQLLSPHSKKKKRMLKQEENTSTAFRRAT